MFYYNYREYKLSILHILLISVYKCIITYNYLVGEGINSAFSSTNNELTLIKQMIEKKNRLERF